ncbi:uncharacterized protein LOC113658007 isoform X4 [Tachysurus fulvidraco]|uniref:uncharacterized protein LOC113658007 isoform X4 n=1 Tax=Tachysurus fulvidraco TaxID=1234273 RepID=UPI001FEF96A9|nr:uncharacterized protein LOC113658007 isoform X4 [Tachysurus fulvidraco]
MKMLHLVLILLVLSGVFTQDSKWGVKYPDKPICAVRGFSVSIKCSYSYPQGHQVKQKLWCSSNLNTYKCEDEYVYNSSLNTKSDFKFTGDDKSDCTLLIHNVQFSYSRVYRFKFITDKDKYTGEPGATLQVTDLKVSLIRLSGNGTLKQGDSLNLTCDVNCTHTSSQFVWSKNNQSLNTSGPVLHFPALTLRDSGDYTCTWGTGETSGSETISLHVEDLGLDTILKFCELEALRPPPPPLSPPSPLLANRYLIYKRLGRGSFGTVYLIEDTRTSRDKLELKV